ETAGCARFDQNTVQGSGRHIDDAFWRGPWRHAFAVEGKIAALQREAAICVRRTTRQVRVFQRDDRAFDARVLSTMDVVEWPGTISIRMISPPSASTISRPTTSSRV